MRLYGSYVGKWGVNYDYLAGVDFASRARALVTYLARRHRFEVLVQAVIRQRPFLRAENYLQSAADEDNKLSWIDNIATGGGPAIEEPPTWTWSREEDE